MVFKQPPRIAPPAVSITHSFPEPSHTNGYTRIGQQVAGQFRRLMIGTDGLSETGKTEFILSCPGAGKLVCLDRGIDGVAENPAPPAQRQLDWGYKVVQVPLATQMSSGADYLPYWKAFYAEWKAALDDPAIRTVGLDGDSDSWELQRLAEFGRLTQIPPILYTTVNAARRAMYARAYDSGKIIICTNKLKREYKPVLDANGNPKIGGDGKEIREATGDYERQGFPDQDYLFSVQLRHMYRSPRMNTVTGKMMPGEFGIAIQKCKVNRELVGEELWGDSCNFQGLVSLLYPNVPLEAWGYR